MSEAFFMFLTGFWTGVATLAVVLVCVISYKLRQR